MMEKRVQGRPSRAAGVVGRKKIIDDIREVLRADDGLPPSRKNLAQAIGVTPALITYYFPERDNLFEEVSLPVIEGHRITLSGIVNRQDLSETKLRDIIAVLHELYGRDRRLYAMYKEMEDRYPDDYAETSTMTRILSAFFGSRDDASQHLSFEAVVLQGAVRRMCEFAEQVRQDASSSTGSAASRSTPAWFESLCSLFAHACVPPCSTVAA